MTTHLALIGTALWGQHWRTNMANELQVNERTVRRWAAGTYDPPENVWHELLALMITRRDTLSKLEAHTKAMLNAT